MELNDILTLGKMGFTAQQVAAFAQMQKVQPQQMAQMQPQQLGQMQPQQLGQMQQMELPGFIGGKIPTNTDPILQQMAALTQAVQASSILASQQPKQETADDVLASIINPPILTGQDKK